MLDNVAHCMPSMPIFLFDPDVEAAGVWRLQPTACLPWPGFPATPILHMERDRHVPFGHLFRPSQTAQTRSG